MAVKDDLTPQAGPADRGQRTERTAERTAERPVASEQPSARRAGSLKDVNRLLGGPLARNTGGEALVHAMTSLKDWLQADKNVGGSGVVQLDKLTILGLESSEHNTQVSAVIFAYPHEQDGKLNVYTYVAALEGSIDGEIPARIYDQNRRQYQVPGVVGDFVTDGYLKTAADIVQKHYSNERRQVEVIDAGWRTVGKLVDFSVKDNPAVRSIAFYAVASLNAMVTADVDSNLFFDLDWLAKGENLDISIDVSRRELQTADLLPRRSDLVISISGSIQVDDTQVRNKLTTVGGYINLVYAPDQEEKGFSRNRDQKTQVFTPIFIMDNLDTGGNAITPELLLLGIAGASVISKSQNWAQVFLPDDVQRGVTDYRDTGFLGLLGQKRSYVEVGNRTNLDIDEWSDYFFSLVREELAWGIEVEEGGDNSWITSLLWAAASGDRDSEDRLWEYADRLTLGNFSGRANDLNVGKFVSLSGSRYLSGTYVDEKGDVRDLRDFDMLRWLVQTGNEDPSIAIDWQETFDNPDIDWEVRVAEQHRMLTSVLGTNLQYSRYVNLLYVNPDAIKALALAVDDCKVGIDQNQTMYTFGNRRLRGNTRIHEFVAGDVSGGIFNRSRDVGGSRGSRRSPLGNGLGRRNF
jgi:hypothetical protein